MKGFIAGVLMLVVSGTPGCDREVRPLPPLPDPPRQGPRPSSEQWDATIRLYERGDARAIIHATYVAVFDHLPVPYTQMDTIDALLMGEPDEESSRLTADTGRIFDVDREGRRRVQTWGGVILEGNQGRTVRADTLWWDEGRDRIHTDGPVEVTQEGEILRGFGFESDTRLDRFEIQRASGISERGGRWLQDEGRRSAAADTVARPPPPDEGAEGA